MRRELGLDLIPFGAELRELVTVPSRSLAREERVSALKEKSAEVELYVWYGIGFLVVVVLAGALFGGRR